MASNTEELLQAYNDRAAFIKLTGHVELDIQDFKAPPNQVYFLVQGNGSYAIWGECSTPLDPAIYDRFDVPPEYRSPTACGMGIGDTDNAFEKFNGGRLFLSNIVVYSIHDGGLGERRMYTAASVHGGAKMWMVNTVVAGPLGRFGNNVPIQVEDASLYFVNSAVTNNNIRDRTLSNMFYYGTAIWLLSYDPKQASGLNPFLGISGSYFQARLINEYMGPIYAEIHDDYGALPSTLVYLNNTVVGKRRGDRLPGVLPPTCGNGTVICTKFAHYAPWTSKDGEAFNPVKSSNPSTGMTVYSDLALELVASDSNVLTREPVSELPAALASVSPEDAEWLQSLKLLGVPGVDAALDPFGLALPPAPAPAPANDSQPAPPGASTLQPPAESPQPRGGDGSSHTGAITGGVVGGVGLLAICTACIVVALKRHRQSSGRFSSSMMTKSSPPTAISIYCETDDASSSYNPAFSWTIDTTRDAVVMTNPTVRPSLDISFTPQKIYAAKSGVIDISTEPFTLPTRTVASESTGTLQLRRVQDASSITEGLQFVRAQISSVIKCGQGLIFGSYILDPVEDMRAGGQGVVYFASCEGGQRAEKLALKFFASERAFLNELDMYRRSGLRSILPPVKDIISNESGSWKDPRGRPIAPAVIMEKGEALNDWAARSAPDIITSLQVMCHVIRAVIDLHKAGLVHRDLKPSNTLWVPSQNRWTIMDFGSTAEAGTSALLSVTLAYTAPESVQALRDGQHMVSVNTTLDVWSLGVMAFELFTGTRALKCSKAEIIAALTGKAPLPWEVPGPELDKKLAKLGAMRPAILAMLHRDPNQRPSLPDVYDDWTGIFDKN